MYTIIRMKYTSIILLFIEFVIIVKANVDKCNILSLEGGGDKGSYQAGVIKGLAYSSNDTQWDVISGISVGAVNGAGISIYPKGQEKEASEFLIRKWKNITGPDSVYKNWQPYGIITGLLSKSGIFSTEPLKQFMDEILAKNLTLKRELIVGATNVKTGGFDIFDFKNLSVNEYIFAILSSASVPFIFPTTNFQKNFYMDGGVKFSINIPSAIQKCRNLGFPDHKIVVDAVLCENNKMERIDTKNLKTIGVMFRTAEIFISDNSAMDLEEVGRIFPNVTLRYVVRPTKSLPTNTALDFQPLAMKQMIEYGIEDGKNAVLAGIGQTYEKIKRENYVEKAKLFLNKKEVTNEEVDHLIKTINQSKLKDFERLKTKFLGKS